MSLKICNISDTIKTFSDSRFKLCARWTIFTTPLASVIQIPEEQDGPLRGCILCISVDGTVAVIVVDGFQLYVVVSNIDSDRLHYLAFISYQALPLPYAESASEGITYCLYIPTIVLDYGMYKRRSFGDR